MEPSLHTHSKPISDSDNFVNRKEEIDKIIFEINNRRNVAVTGPNGIGKTSLSHVVEDELQSEGVLTTRITLNPDDVEDERIFFKKVIEEITNEIGGKAHEDYINWLKNKTDAVELNFKFLKLHFGDDAVDPQFGLIESALREDLEDLVRRANSSEIVIFIDKSEYLSNSTSLLQRIENIFSEWDMYTIVLIGTETMFSDISTAHSSIARMFTKFSIGPFSDIRHTEQCIKNPLEPDIEKVVDNKTVGEIHAITGGHPYEINLICSRIYSHYLDGEISDFVLAPEILDDVVTQIESWHENADDAEINGIKKLDREELYVLARATEYPFTDAENLCKYIKTCDLRLDGGARNGFSEIDIQASIDSLIEKDILASDDEQVGFSGSSYMLAYIKYLSYARDVVSDFTRITDVENPSIAEKAEIHYRIVDEVILNQEQGCHSHFDPDEHISDASHFSIRGIQIPNLTDHDDEGMGSKGIAAVGGLLSDNSIVKFENEEYFRKGEHHEDTQYSAGQEIYFRINIPWLDSGFKSVIHIDDPESKERYVDRIFRLKEELEEIGYELILEDEVTLLREGNDAVKSERYITAEKKYTEAINLNESYPLPWYNRARLYYNQEEYEDALNDTNRAIELQSSWTDAYFLKAITLIELERPKEAKDVFLEVAKINEDDIDVWAKACHILDEKGYYQEAIEMAEEAISQDHKTPHIVYHLARSLHNIGEYEKCKSQVNELNSMGENRFKGLPRTDFLEAYNSFFLGEIETSLEMSKGCLDATDLDEDFQADVYVLISKCHIEMDNRDEAKEYLSKAIETYPEVQEILRSQHDYPNEFLESHPEISRDAYEEQS